MQDQVTKRRVTMTRYSVIVLNDTPTPVKEEAVDYVRPDHLEAYVAAARNAWQTVEVSDDPDAGPGGYHGQTAVPAHLDVADAGAVYPSTEED